MKMLGAIRLIFAAVILFCAVTKPEAVDAGRSTVDRVDAGLEGGGYMEEYYKFEVKQAVSPEVDKPPTIDGRLEEGLWEKAVKITDLTLAGTGEVPTQATEVRLAHRGGVLYIAFRCHETRMDKRRTTKNVDPKEHFREALDRIEFFFDTNHDHHTYWKLAVDCLGKAKISSGYGLRGEVMADVEEGEEEKEIGKSLAARIVDEKTSWTGEVALPLSALGESGSLTGRVWGFNINRQRRPHPEEVSLWSGDPKVAPVVPADFGDLIFGDPNISVKEIDLGKPFWGENTATLIIENKADKARKIILESSVYLPVDEVTYHKQITEAEIAAEKTAEVRVPYKLSCRGKWGVYHQYIKRLIFTIKDAESNAVLYQASFPMAFDRGLKVNERYGQNPNAPNPSPDDPDFVEKKRAYIIGRIPQFKRLNTLTGGESDFVLAATDGSVRFNLMEPGVMQKIADWLYGLFDNDQDRLLGATFFIHQRTVTRHSGTLSKLRPGSPLSRIRLGGGLCGNRAAILAGLLTLMKCERTGLPGQGRPYKTHCLGLAGHVVTAVDTTDEPHDDGSHIVLDPDVGLMFFTLDNKRLATLNDLRREREISYRVNYHHIRHGHEFYFGAYHQRTYGWHRPGTFPEGAPEW